jgi:PhoH-like ATPase
MPLPPLPTQIADQVNLSRQKQPELKNPPKKPKKMVSSPTWVEEVDEGAEHDLSAAEAALERIKTDAPAQYLEKKLESKNERPKRTIRTGPPSLFVLDTNVLMHDPSSLFRFEEHDLYLPMTTLEELDNHKKGMSEVARNARMVSRSLDQLAPSGRTARRQG